MWVRRSLFSPRDIDDDHHYITIEEMIFESLRLY
jgi:hypothetical protein